jgi:arsenite methyltransferase
MSEQGRPNPDLARCVYRRLAHSYDRQLRWLRHFQESYRARAVQELRLQPGQTVLDVGCGTGASFELLEQEIGPSGQIIGIDQSPEMLAHALARKEENGWHNISLITEQAQTADVKPLEVDAAFFFFTHDILRSPEALEAVLRSLRRGGRVAAAGIKRGPRWAAPFDLALRTITRRYVTTSEGLSRPWSHLESYLTDFRVEAFAWGMIYVTSGSKV